MKRVAVAYESEFGPGMFMDNAKAIAPRKPANHKTHCIFIEILFSPRRRQQLAIHDMGKIFIALPIKQNNNPMKAKNTSQFLNRPVNTHIPM
mmetsp:Transcript_640/g.1309  ORF Transcript_640/g.1309 Transcript_640/m.1309 type:complete len:92 (+) Transcript_640:407-682(+)